MDLASNILQVNMKFPNHGPLCCMLRPKMMRNSWTLKGRLQYILARGLLQKKKNFDKNEMKERRAQRWWIHCKPTRVRWDDYYEWTKA